MFLLSGLQKTDILGVHKFAGRNSGLGALRMPLSFVFHKSIRGVRAHRIVLKLCKLLNKIRI